MSTFRLLSRFHAIRAPVPRHMSHLISPTLAHHSTNRAIPVRFMSWMLNSTPTSTSTSAATPSRSNLGIRTNVRIPVHIRRFLVSTSTLPSGEVSFSVPSDSSSFVLVSFEHRIHELSEAIHANRHFLMESMDIRR